MIIMVAGMRGGSGRTTTAYGLAAAAALMGQTVRLILVDGVGIADGAGGGDWKSWPISIHTGHAEDVPGWLAARTAPDEVVIVDLPPGRHASLEHADVIVVPVHHRACMPRPSAGAETGPLRLLGVEHLITAGRPLVVVPCRVLPRERADELRAAGRDGGVYVAEAEIGETKALRMAITPYAVAWAALAPLHLPLWQEVAHQAEARTVR
ncbi:hypothetical protein [Bailinhaonella thermotolerans]|uniref:ParA family protein n=1 Tax=Bailinhaonella thermotolerans TaxID=1070861 RepID=A0A3A4A1F5_9ACTN|nr:hypothetical protein [Bailinhaonella thermotolerans]RJL21092.1 hypothetical protein D5H75_38425 [Bailinhaonella thermotolerans]